MPGWLTDALTLAIAPTFLLVLAGVAGWFYRQHRESGNARLLVASEIQENYGSLERFFMASFEIPMTPEQRLDLALYYDQQALYPPTFRRVRWDNVPLNAFKTEDVYNITGWYYDLQGVQDFHNILTARSAITRRWIESKPEDIAAFHEALLEDLKTLEEGTRQLMSKEPPYIDKNLEKIHKKKLKALSETPTPKVEVAAKQQQPHRSGS